MFFFFPEFGFTVNIKVLKKIDPSINLVIWNFFLQNLGYLNHFLHEKSFEVCKGLKPHFSG
jgi:hypothetical protein